MNAKRLGNNTMVGFKTHSDSFTFQQKAEKSMNSSFMTFKNERDSLVPETKKIRKIMGVIYHLDNYEIMNSLKLIEKVRIKHRKFQKMVMYTKELSNFSFF